MNELQQKLAKYPIYCSKCSKKTESIAGTIKLKKRNKSHYMGGACQICRRGKNSTVGGSIVDKWLAEWNNRAPEAIRELHLIQQADDGGKPKKSSFCGRIWAAVLVKSQCKSLRL